MGLQNVLSYGVMILGFLLCAFSVLFMLLGRKIPGDQGTPQVIRFKALEVRTNSVLMLFIVSVLVAALPLVLLYYRAVPPSPVTVSTPKDQRHPVFITGYVQDETGRPLGGTQVSLFKLSPDGQSQLVSDQVVESDGSFNFSHRLAEEDRIKVTTKKSGYANQSLILGVDSVNYPAILVRRKEP